MLELDEELRRRLLVRHALIVDEDGDEVFAGLTVSESVFYLEFVEHPDLSSTTAEKMLYLQLKHRHLVARCSYLSICLRSADYEGEPSNDAHEDGADFTSVSVREQFR